MRYVSGPDGKWIPVTKKGKPLGVMIWNDLEDYRPVAGPEAEKFVRKSKDARFISGRKQHREYLRRNGLQEAGTNIDYFIKNSGKTDDNPTKDWLRHGTDGTWTAPNLERLMRGRK